MIRFHMVISGFTWSCLRYIRARSRIMYPYVFVAGPNKHDLFPCVNDQRKFQQSASYPNSHCRRLDGYQLSQLQLDDTRSIDCRTSQKSPLAQVSCQLLPCGLAQPPFLDDSWRKQTHDLCRWRSYGKQPSLLHLLEAGAGMLAHSQHIELSNSLQYRI
jgi:hypothetical protein